MAKNIQEQEASQNPQAENIAVSPLAPYTRHLMVVVVILGLVLVVGTGVVISTIIDRLGTGLALSTAESTQREELGVSLPEVIDVKLPDGLSLLRVAPAGKDVLLELGNERTELIWIVNPKTGEIKSALRIN
jgi:hypothetical protein